MIPGTDLNMFILDAIQDDIEDLGGIMRYLKEWRFAWPHNFTDGGVLIALKELILKDCVSVLEERNLRLEHVEQPSVHEEDLRRYWYAPTANGRQMWRQWESPPLPPETDRSGR